MRSLVLRAPRTEGILDQAYFRFVAMAAAVAAADLISKAVAVWSLEDMGPVALSNWFFLYVVYNTGSAGSVMVGSHSMQVDVLITVLAVALIALIVRAMALVDARSTRALAFVAGGAIGNLSSMLWGPDGVADFLAIRLSSNFTMIANVADLALWAGAAMLAPVALLLFRLALAERVAMLRAPVAVR